MENQQTEEQQRHDALNKALETMDVPEAANLACGILARMLLAHGIEPWSERWDGFHDALQVHLAARFEALDSARLH